MKFKSFLIGLLLVSSINGCQTGSKQVEKGRWSIEKAKTWHNNDWLVGCNYTPRTAINQLEFWQHETFDTLTINQELGWAHEIGFNVIRVYLHLFPWQDDAVGFKNRMDIFLQIAQRNDIGVIFVLWDDCWNWYPKRGKQPEPEYYKHNSGWVQNPGWEMLTNTSQLPVFEKFVKDILSSFSNDSRIVLWDLYNEPMPDKPASLLLLQKTFEWAQEVRPSQPLTVAIFKLDRSAISENKIITDNSDIISFHTYTTPDSTAKLIDSLLQFNRPVICSEYMARPIGSTFENHLPLFKKNHVHAFNWGFVAGKTLTYCPWGSKKGDPEPELWFHDILHNDGSPYNAAEVTFIKQIINK